MPVFSKFLTHLTLSQLFCCAMLFGGQASETAGASGSPENQRTDLNNLSLEPVGPGDLVYVTVTNWAEVTRTYRVSIDGTISLPALKTNLAVSGLGAAEIERRISRALVSEKILVDPIVSATVVEYRSKSVDVAGAVHHPVTFQALGPMRLLDAIAKAEGLSADAGSEVLVYRPAQADSLAETKHVSLKHLIDGSDASLNTFLHGGEQIRIPTAGKLYIIGNVKLPGAYSMTEEGGVSVLKALALCQGMLPFSQDTAYILRANPNSNTRTEVSVPIKQIMKRHAPDIQLAENDILYIPDNTGKKLTAEVFEKLGAFGGSTVSGLLIFR